MILKRIYLFLAFCMLGFVHAQLDNIHYLQPIIFTEYSDITIDQEYIYLSTPSPTNITVTITRPNGAAAPRMSVTNIGVNTTYVTDGVVTLNNSTPLRLQFINASNVAVSPGVNPITRPAEDAGVVTGSIYGLIFRSTDNFFVNYRGRSESQAGSVLTKGRVALGKNFFWGGTPTEFATTVLSVGNMASMMATEDNTVITVSGIDPGTQFINGPNPATPLTGTTITRTLQKGQSFILYAKVRNNQLSIQDTGWLGAKITSTKDIAVTVGGLMQQGAAAGSRDFAVDQLVPVEQLGNEYVVMQGYGGTNEKVIVIATEPNTTISLNGNTGTADYTITNAGGYRIISANNPNTFINKNMYIKTNKPVYVFHKIYGSDATNTNSFMFIPPLSCFGQTEVNMIPDARRIGGTIYESTQLAVLAASGSANAPVVSVNNITLATPTSFAVPGNTNWRSYRYNITENVGGTSGIKNVRVSSAGTIQAELIGANGDAGFGGYYSGFGTAPVVTVNITNSPNPLRPCTGGSGSSSLSVTSGLGTYQWYKNNVAIPGAVSNTYSIPSTDNISAEYNVIVTIPGGCLVYSDVVSSFICPCYKPGVTGTPEITKIGISTRETASTPNFPADINNGFIALESNDKGLVITRMPEPEISITNPVDGMLVYDTDENCLKIYNGTQWSCINQTCN